MRYANVEGNIFTAQDAGDLVHQLHEASLSQCSSDAEFMRESAKRVKVAVGKEIEFTDADSFVAAMVAAGFLKEVEEK